MGGWGGEPWGGALVICFPGKASRERKKKKIPVIFQEKHKLSPLNVELKDKSHTAL